MADEDNNQNERHEQTKGYTYLPNYSINRSVLRQEDFVDKSGYQRQDHVNYLQSVRQTFSTFSLLKFILNVIPVLKWLPSYSIKAHLPGDISAGITVAVMHIPQGMAYGLLAGVTPSSGLYMAFFPTLVYFVFGTSRHISVGTLSVISLMTLKLVQTYATQTDGMPKISNSTDTLHTTLTPFEGDVFTPMQVVTAAAFMCGVHQILMSLLRLGSLSSLLSEPLINGFTTGAAVHVTISQLTDLFGIKIPRYKGAFKIIYTVIDCIPRIPDSNVATVVISAIVILFMVFMNEIMKPRCNKLCKFPVPAELIAVVGGTAASHILSVGSVYGVRLVGNIPMGLPLPELPPIRLLGLVAFDSIAIAIVSYTVTISMALIFAKKQNYEVDPNQELLAMGLSNIVGGAFSCVPNATSLSRSLIQEQTGGKSQIASVVSAFLILIILLWIAPFFQVLPRCVLSGIIVVALKGMYTQAGDLKRFHKESKLESITWVITFMAVVLVDVDIGLVFGIACSLITMYIKGWKSQNAVLGELPGTGLYVNIDTHHKAVQIPFVKIFQYTGAVNFASSSSFKRSLYDKIDGFTANKSLDTNTKEDCDVLRKLQPHALIIDLSNVTHVDIAACKVFSEIQTDLLISNTVTYLASPNDRIHETLRHAELLSINKFAIFPSVHDAVLYFKASAAENA